jgi:hypothetical protein
MKRLLTLVTTLALVAMFTTPALAQEDPGARLGLQGGISVSSFTGDDAPSGSSSKTGFLAGVTFDYFFSDNFGIGLEGNWLAGLGEKVSESEVKLSYLSFPLTLTGALALGSSEKTWLGLEAGFAANLRLTCDGSIADIPGGTNVDCKDDAESVVWSVPLGASIGFMASDAAVVYLKGRYQLGLSNTFKDVESSSIEAKLSWWEFILGVSFAP